MYYGEEIGMRDISLRRSEILDPPGKKYWPVYKGRDGCRSPMQWSDAPSAGSPAPGPGCRCIRISHAATRMPSEKTRIRCSISPNG